MPLVAASHVSVHYGGPLLLEDVTQKVEPGARVGLIGPNGSGKSTLLRLLAGRQSPSEGEVVFAQGAKVGHQAQELEHAPEATLREEMRLAFPAASEREARLRDLEARLAEAPPAGREALLREYARLQEQHERSGSYAIDRRIESVLSSLGLGAPTWERPLEDFSGGERNVIGLARVLLSDPDLLLLDEPTNHLDMEGIEWFIRFLRRTRAAVVVVSHNRHVLDAVADEIWEIDRARVRSWPGNYSDFQRQRAETLARQLRQYKVQQRLVERIRFQARRLMDMANAYDDPAQAKRAKAMLRRLERMDLVERPSTEPRRFRASLAGGRRHGRIALAVRDFTFAHEGRSLFEGASLEIEYGERVCLVGPNGSGKTTLFRRILAEGGWENPVLRLGRSVRVGEYRQRHDVLDSRATLLDWAMETMGLERSPAKSLLHRFLFAHEDLDRRVGTLSGGEKSRLQIARLVQQRVNLLLLDEPTNHLDIEACEVLEEMLLEYEGTLFVISHDRYFLDRLVERVVEVRDRRLVDHRTTFAAWWQERSEALLRPRRAALEGPPEEERGKEGARRAFEDRREWRRERDRLRSRVRELEREVQALERRHAETRERLERAYGPDGDPREADRLARLFADVERDLSAGYAEWAKAVAALESQPPPEGVPG